MIAGQLHQQPQAISDLRDPVAQTQSVQFLLTQPLREMLQGVSQFSLANDPEAVALVRALQDYSVGPEGPTVRWETGDAQFDRAIEAAWRRYFYEIGPGSIDCRGMHAGPYLLRQLIDAWCMSGRLVSMICGLDDAGTMNEWTGSVQMIDGLRIRNPMGRIDDDTMIAGVELSPLGRPEAVHVADWARAGQMLSLTTTKIESGFLYLPNPMATGFDLIAPAPALSLVVPSLVWRSMVLQSTVYAAIKEASMNAWVKRASDGESLSTEAAGRRAELGADADGLTTDERGRAVHRAGRPGIEYLAEDEDVVLGASNYPSQALPAFLEAIMTRIAAPFGLSPEMVTNDLNKLNFSAARLQMQMVGRRMRSIQHAIETQFLLPIIRRAFVPAAILRGELPATLPGGWDRPTITFEPMPEPDPAKAAVQRLTEMRGLDRDLQMVAEDRGLELDELVARLTSDAAVYEALGIPHPAGQIQQPAAGGDSQPGRAGGEEAGGGAPGEGTDDQTNTIAGGSTP